MTLNDIYERFNNLELLELNKLGIDEGIIDLSSDNKEPFTEEVINKIKDKYVRKSISRYLTILYNVTKLNSSVNSDDLIVLTLITLIHGMKSKYHSNDDITEADKFVIKSLLFMIDDEQYYNINYSDDYWRMVIDLDKSFSKSMKANGYDSDTYKGFKIIKGGKDDDDGTPPTILN